MVDGKLFSVPIYPERSMKIFSDRKPVDMPSNPTQSRDSVPGAVGLTGVALPHYPPLACFDEFHQIIYLGCSRHPVPSQLFQSLLGI
jgi:hypothetical protein